MAKTDRQLLQEIHDKVISPVLFPSLEFDKTEDGPLGVPGSFLAPFYNMRIASHYLNMEVFSIDNVSFRMRFKYNDLPPSREFFFQLGRVKE